MNSDLQKAKRQLLLSGSTCVLCRGELQYTSDRRGVQPLLEFLDSGTDLQGFSAADKVVGRATAFLYCLLGVKEVWAQVMSAKAQEVFRQYGIAFSCQTQVPGVRSRAGDGPCPMEQATQTARTPQEALLSIRTALARMS